MTAVPQAAIDLAKRFEGFHRVPKHDLGRAYPYICPAGYWTIGYGRLCDPQQPPISKTDGEAYLLQDLGIAMTAALRYCPLLATEPESRPNPIKHPAKEPEIQNARPKCLISLSP